MSRYSVQLLTSDHIRKEFSCKHPSLENYIVKYVTQDVKRKLAACYVVTNESNEVIGYYTLSTDSIESDVVSEAIKKKMPPGYKNLPATLLGRLAVTNDFQGKGIGQLLLVDALQRSYANSLIIASMAVIVDPIDLNAESFYLKYGFIKLPDSGKMFIAMKTLAYLTKK